MLLSLISKLLLIFALKFWYGQDSHDLQDFLYKILIL
jgi:hypothetical protein